LIVTHNERILRALATKLIVFHRGKVDVFDSDYDEFLEKIGWEEEDPGPIQAAPVVTPEAKPNPNKKEQRKQRSEVVAERSKALNPLKQEMESLEKNIQVWEGEVAGLNAQLVEASQGAKIESFVGLSKAVKELQSKIDEAYAKLDRVTTQHEEKSKFYAERLEDSED